MAAMTPAAALASIAESLNVAGDWERRYGLRTDNAEVIAVWPRALWEYGDVEVA